MAQYKMTNLQYAVSLFLQYPVAVKPAKDVNLLIFATTVGRVRGKLLRPRPRLTRWSLINTDSAEVRHMANTCDHTGARALA